MANLVYSSTTRLDVPWLKMGSEKWITLGWRTIIIVLSPGRFQREKVKKQFELIYVSVLNFSLVMMTAIVGLKTLVRSVGDVVSLSSSTRVIPFYRDRYANEMVLKKWKNKTWILYYCVNTARFTDHRWIIKAKL